MYNPPRFKSEDIDEAFELMDRHPFATVMTVADGQTSISHLPMTAKRVGREIEIIGHLAKANPHWKALASGATTIVFQGPHAYITPKWYEQNDVPTWNYLAVHVNGPIELFETEDKIIECLKDLSTQAERHWPSGWEFYIPEDLKSGRLTKAIAAFRMRAEKIDYKKKLSQHQKTADREGAIKGLATREDENSKAIRKEMIKATPKT